MHLKCLNTICFHYHEKCCLPPDKCLYCRLASIPLLNHPLLSQNEKHSLLHDLLLVLHLFSNFLSIYPFNFLSGTSAFLWSRCAHQYQHCSSSRLLTEEQGRERERWVSRLGCPPPCSTSIRMQCTLRYVYLQDCPYIHHSTVPLGHLLSINSLSEPVSAASTSYWGFWFPRTGFCGSKVLQNFSQTLCLTWCPWRRDS